MTVPAKGSASQLARDSGLQSERTGLAWMRTATVTMITALLMLRAGVRDPAQYILLSASGLLVLLAAIFAYWGRRRLLETERQAGQPQGISRGLIKWTVFILLTAAGLFCFSLLNSGA